MGTLEAVGNSIGRYVMKHFVEPRLRRTVSFYRAKVISAASDGKITVQRPAEDAVELPCVTSAAGLQAGEQCVVLVFGSGQNAVVLGDGKLSNL